MNVLRNRSAYVAVSFVNVFHGWVDVHVMTETPKLPDFFFHSDNSASEIMHLTAGVLKRQFVMLERKCR